MLIAETSFKARAREEKLRIEFKLSALQCEIAFDLTKSLIALSANDFSDSNYRILCGLCISASLASDVETPAAKQKSTESTSTETPVKVEHKL